MAKYTYECNMGHEPKHMEVMAENDDMAMSMMMDQCNAHLAEHHSDMPAMGEEEMRTMIMAGWHKEEEGGMGEGSADMGMDAEAEGETPAEGEM